MKKTTITLITIASCFYSCVFDHVDGFEIANHSDKGQVVCYTCSDSIGSVIDSLTNNPHFKQFDHFKTAIFDKDVYIDKKESQPMQVVGRKESIVRRCEDKHVRFFFISDSVFTNNPWDTIVKYQMYNRKLVFSEEDLKKSNWTVIYE